MAKEQKVTPWVVEGDIDYEKLVKEFGTELIDQQLIDKFERITGHPAHPWIKRGIFFSHRRLNEFLDAYENGEPVFLYTGRGPTSDSMHVGHMIPFMFTKWLQDVFDCPLVIQMSDDEKYYFKPLEFSEVYRLGFENSKDIIACGFNPKKTFIFSNRDYRLSVDQYEVFVSDMKKLVTVGTVRKIFGFDNETINIGCYDWPIYQSAAAFSKAFPHIFGGRPAHCLVAYAIDQDPYFRLARDLASKMSLIKPYSIMSSFIPPLASGGKMSSSVGTEATIFLTDSPETVEKKVMTYAFSGGGGNGSLEDHRKFGGDIKTDISYQYLRFFEFDDQKLQQIRKEFSSGQMSCGEIKKLMASKLVEVIAHHAHQKSLVTQEMVKDFYEHKPMELRPPVQKKMTAEQTQLHQLLDQLKISSTTKYHPVVTSREMEQDLMATLEGVLCKNMLLQANDQYYLVISDPDKKLNLADLKKLLPVIKLKIAEKNAIQDILCAPKDCATLFALMFPHPKKIDVIIMGIDPSKKVNFSPMRSDATMTISYQDMIRILQHYNIDHRVL